MDDEVLLDAGAVTQCRRRVHLEHDRSMRDAPLAPPDPGVQQRVADAAEHRERVGRWLADALGPGWAEVPNEGGREHREDATLAAMRSGARYIYRAQLPSDGHGGRRGAIDLLVRTDDGYVPVLVVRHKITDPGSGARTGPLSSPLPGSAAADPDRKARSHSRDQLKLAHVLRLLQAAGWNAPSLVGGVIGVDADVVLWHDLESSTWPGGRSTLEEYDARFADRMAVASAAAQDRAPLALPSRINECKGCPWWPTCEAHLRESRDVSLVIRGEDATVLRDHGVSTVDELAEMPRETAEAAALTAASTADGPLLAKAWLQDVPLVRRVRDVEVPRADVEVDVDMESYADSGAYLWGCLLTGTDVGVAPGYWSFATWTPLPCRDEARSFAEFWSWLTAVRLRSSERGLSFRAYCYNELAENRWMFASAERFAGEPGIPAAEEVRAFTGSEQWVDLFASVRDQFLCPNGKGLKVIAPSAGFAWRDAEAGGENSMRWYRDAVGMDGHPPVEQQRERLLQYNEDDVRATCAVRRWMSSEAVSDMPYAGDL